MADVVLDASAVIAVIKREAGWQTVVQLMPGATISTVNLSEVALWFVRQGKAHDQVEAEIGAFQVVAAAFDRRLAVAAAILEPKTRHLGLSLADRACLALAQDLSRPVVTADRAWRDLDLGVEINFIR